MARRDAYLRLVELLADERRTSAAADAMVAELGPPAALIRGLVHARRREWTRARVDLRAATEVDGQRAPLIDYVAGVALYVARDYDRALARLRHAAGAGKPGVARQARLSARSFASALGWSQEQRELEAELGVPPPPELVLDGDPGHAAARAWSLVFERGPELARSLLARLAAEAPEHPAVRAAQARVELLSGAPEAAARCLTDLSDPLRCSLRSERALIALASGQLDEVLGLTDDPGDDPRLLCLRGEAFRASGVPDQACALLERARQRRPGSVVISLALALARHQQAPDRPGDGFARRFDDLVERAPALLGDAADRLGLGWTAEDGQAHAREVGAAILAEARRMLTADLDLSQPSYRRAAGGPLRHIPEAVVRDHDHDRAMLEHVERLLFRALDINPPRPESAVPRPTSARVPRVWTAQTLTTAELEQFLADGFIVLRAAFDPALARAWREDASRRIREEPERWVRGYDPNDPKRSLRGFDPADSSTWTWESIHLEGPETVAIEQFAPRAWGVICDLLGGPERIETRTWTNYSILNLCVDAHTRVDAPIRAWKSWHIDDPSPVTRLDRIVNGLIGITLFDRVLPNSGNTWIAPDSVARVARELAEHPAGVDFVNHRGSALIGECERFHEITGEAGDLVLMHPLMMHAASPNRSGRIRWMGNPMVYLRDPLDPYRPEPELSPVERVIRDAIGPRRAQ